MKTELTGEQWEEMGNHALDGCQDGTIAGLMDISSDTIHSSKKIQRFLWKKRCERKSKKRKEQDDHAKKHPVMSIFQGKNELGQTDKQEFQHHGDIEVNLVMYGSKGSKPTT